MDRKDLRRHLRDDSDKQLSQWLDELNAAELAATTARDRIWAREAAYVVANVLVNRKADVLRRGAQQAPTCADGLLYVGAFPKNT